MKFRLQHLLLNDLAANSERRKKIIFELLDEGINVSLLELEVLDKSPSASLLIQTFC